MKKSDNITLFQDAVQGIYRLFRVAGLHDITNDAVDESIHSFLAALQRLTDGQRGVLLLFARDTVLVNGQLLPMPPDTWEIAMSLQRYLQEANFNSLWLGIEADRDALRILLRYFRKQRGGASAEDLAIEPDARGYIATGIRVRRVADELVVGIDSPELSESERALLTYALAVRGVRTLSTQFQTAPAGFTSYFKRVAWQLSRFSVTQLRHLLDIGSIDRDDQATRVVQTGLLAGLIARLLSMDEREVGAVLLAALQLDASDARDRMAATFRERDPAVDAVVLQMVLNGLRGDSCDRALLAFEAQRILQPGRERVHRWNVPATLTAHCLAAARTFIEVYSRAQLAGHESPVDAALLGVRNRAAGTPEVLSAELLALALGTPGPGAAVELNNGARGIVLRSGPTPGRAALLSVMLLEGAGVRTSAEIHLRDVASQKLWGWARPLEVSPAWERPPAAELATLALAALQWQQRVNQLKAAPAAQPQPEVEHIASEKPAPVPEFVTMPSPVPSIVPSIVPSLVPPVRHEDKPVAEPPSLRFSDEMGRDEAASPTVRRLSSVSPPASVELAQARVATHSAPLASNVTEETGSPPAIARAATESLSAPEVVVARRLPVVPQVVAEPAAAVDATEDDFAFASRAKHSRITAEEPGIRYWNPTAPESRHPTPDLPNTPDDPLPAGVNLRRRSRTTDSSRRVTGSGGYVLAQTSSTPDDPASDEED